MHEYTYNLSLSISHPSLELESLLDVFAPAISWKKGEDEITNIKKGKLKRPVVNDENYCYFEVVENGGATITEDIKAFIKKVENKQELFNHIVDTGGIISLGIGWYIKSNAGEIIPWNLLAELVELKINLTFDVYEDKL